MNTYVPDSQLGSLVTALPEDQRRQAEADLKRFIRIVADVSKEMARDPASYAQFQALTKRRNRSTIGSGHHFRPDS
ncbi:MAG: hypothetical protein AAB353_03595 [Candidatus Hydrogenedentota bacterium]